MHALERAALEDPFLAEAIEGYQVTEQVPAEAIDELRERLSARVARGERRNMAWAMSVAAGLVLCLSLGAWVFFRQDEPIPIAGSMERKMAVTDSTPLEPAPSSVNDNIPSTAPTGENKREEAKSSPSIAAAANQNAEAPVTAADDQRPSAATAVPLPEQKKIAAATMKARMPEQTMAAPVADSTQASEPTIGWTAYRAYIAKNIRKQSPDAPKGEVELSFRVNDAGRPYDIRIETKLSPAQDQEAARLIGEGPAWKRLKDNVRVRYRINF
jgi:hypothetical protein